MRVRPTCTYVSETYLPKRPHLSALVAGLDDHPDPPLGRLSKEKRSAVQRSEKVSEELRVRWRARWRWPPLLAPTPRGVALIGAGTGSPPLHKRRHGA